MKLITFCNIDSSLIDSKYTVESFDNRTDQADIAIIDINTIFDFEENKSTACKENFLSIAIIDDAEDYDAFKNFGIDAWIKQEDISKINELLDMLSKRL